MPPRPTDREQRLIAAYIEAASRIDRAIREIGSNPRKAVLLAKVNPVIRQLNELTSDYLSKDLPEQFRLGSTEAVSLLGNHVGTINEQFTTIHKEALQQIADGAAKGFGRSIQELANSASRAFSQARKQQIVQEILTSEITGEPVQAKKILLDANVTGIRAGNRTLSVDHYVSTLTHTVLAEAHNMGAATRYMENGVAFGQRIERADAPDKPCQWMRNKIIWLGETRFIGPIHPNCMGGIKPYFGDTSNAFRRLDDPRIPQYVKDALAKKQ